MRLFRFLRGVGSFTGYYKLVNELYEAVYGKSLMLHYPFYKDDQESIEQRQINLVDHCIGELPDLSNKTLLEIGCGNGANLHYISREFSDVDVIGIDLNGDNLKIAMENNAASRATFLQDDAQKLEHIQDSTVDVLICIESAFHYPDKHAFFSQIKRVLKPNGRFLIADILLRSDNRGRSLWWWKKAMRLNHANEEAYLSYASGNQLSYTRSQDITHDIMKGYQGYRNWVTREARSWASFLLLRFTVSILVRIHVNQLRKHKRYMVFTGEHS